MLPERIHQIQLKRVRLWSYRVIRKKWHIETIRNIGAIQSKHWRQFLYQTSEAHCYYFNCSLFLRSRSLPNRFFLWLFSSFCGHHSREKRRITKSDEIFFYLLYFSISCFITMFLYILVSKWNFSLCAYVCDTSTVQV